MLDATVNHGAFSYHPKCKKVKLTHLCFADDLLIFAKGNLESIIGIKNVLQQFHFFSRLHLNCAKSEFFSIGIFRNLFGKIHQFLRFKIDSLPVRYLGVPLVTRRLSYKDCTLLVDKIEIGRAHV